MGGTIRKNLDVIISYLLILSAGTLVVLTCPKTELHLMINSFHSPFFDTFFRLLTWLGDGWVAAIIASCFLLVKIRWSFILFLSYLFSGLFVQFLKRAVFPESPRPLAYFEGIAELYLVPGVGMHTHLSFPSGHTATAFAVFISISLMVKNRLLRIGFLLLACLTGFSRVYLSQHFLQDVLAGSLAGTLFALIFYWYFHRLKYGWLDRSIISGNRRNEF